MKLSRSFYLIGWSCQLNKIVIWGWWLLSQDASSIWSHPHLQNKNSAMTWWLLSVYPDQDDLCHTGIVETQVQNQCTTSGIKDSPVDLNLLVVVRNSHHLNPLFCKLVAWGSTVHHGYIQSDSIPWKLKSDPTLKPKTMNPIFNNIN